MVSKKSLNVWATISVFSDNDNILVSWATSGKKTPFIGSQCTISHPSLTQYHGHISEVNLGGRT